jgi:3-phenylpropionate/cinnamic acid dioxygenase small subunit
MTDLQRPKSEVRNDFLLQHQAAQFLYREARLLDERRLSEWLELLAEDLHYFMPLRRNIKYGDWHLEYSDPETEISYFDEDKSILTGRVRQIETGVHWAEEPVSRFEHIISNVEVTDQIGDEIYVNSKFYTYQNRLADEVQVFCGRRYDVLRRDEVTDFKIVKRKILIAQNVLLAKVINTFF